MAKTLKQKSEERVKVLEHEILEAVKNTAEKVEGDFTVCEINEALIKAMYTYNKVGLNQQRNDYKGGS